MPCMWNPVECDPEDNDQIQQSYLIGEQDAGTVITQCRETTSPKES